MTIIHTTTEVITVKENVTISMIMSNDFIILTEVTSFYGEMSGKDYKTEREIILMKNHIIKFCHEEAKVIDNHAFKLKARKDAIDIETLAIPCAGSQDNTFKCMMDMVHAVMVLTNDVSLNHECDKNEY